MGIPMGPFAALNSVIVNAFRIRGRAPRSEYWWFFLWDLVIGIAALGIDIWTTIQTIRPLGIYPDISTDPFDYLFVYWALISFIPRLTVTIRRLHDGGFSGFWYLMHIVPLGSVVVFVLTLFPSNDDNNIYGPPRARPSGKTTNYQGTGKPHDPMQGYAYLEASRQAPTPEMLADRKAQIRALYEQRVLGQTEKPA